MPEQIVFANELPYQGVSNDPLDSLRDILAFSSRDWGESRDVAWIYGIILGWDDESFDDLAALFGWTSEQIERLKRLHANFEHLVRPTIKDGDDA